MSARSVDLGERRFKRTLPRDWLRFWAYLLWPVLALAFSILMLPIPHVMVAGVIGLFVMPLAASRVVGFRRGDVCVDEEGIQLPGGAIKKRAIRAAFYVPAAADRPGRLELQGEKGKSLGAIEIGDPTAAAAAIDALGMSGTQPVAHFGAVAPGWSPAMRWLRTAILLGVIGFIVGTAMAIPVLAGLGIFAATVVPLILLKAYVQVGADGMLVVTRGSRTYFGWADVRELGPAEDGIVIHTRSGDFAVPTVSGFRALTEPQKEDQAALLEKARQALAEFRRRPSRSLGERLARRGRPIEKWLRGLKNPEGDYRRQPLSPDELLQVIEDPQQESTARAAAAAALRTSASDDDRDRIRIAADACAGDKLRIALREAADPSTEQALEEALVALGEEDRRTARSRR